MADDSTIVDFIARTGVKIVAEAPTELQKEPKEIAAAAGMPLSTLEAVENGQNKITLLNVKRLLKVKGMAPLLSRLFAPEGFLLVPRETIEKVRHELMAAHAVDYLAAYTEARSPGSEWGVDIGPTEEQRLDSKVTVLRAGGEA